MNAICGMDVGRAERIMRFSTGRGVFHYFISRKLTNCDAGLVELRELELPACICQNMCAIQIYSFNEKQYKV